MKPYRAILSLSVLLASCSASSALEGTWRKQGAGSFSLEFRKDGSLVYQGATKDYGEWKQTPEGRININIGLTNVTCSQKVEGNSLTLSACNNVAGVYQRVQ